MSDNKKYYYLKLKEGFYGAEELKLLESMENGFEYSSLYLKLCLLSLKGEGKLLYKNRIPYKPEMLSTITGHSIEVINYAIPIMKELEMLTILDNGTIFIDDMQNLVGHGSTEGERKSQYRKRIKDEKKLLGHCPDERPLELSKDKLSKERVKKKKPTLSIPPSLEEVTSYLQEKEIIQFTADYFCDYYSSRGWMVGKNKMKDWKAAVRTWNSRNKTDEKSDTRRILDEMEAKGEL